MTSKVYIANKDVEISMNQFFFQTKTKSGPFWQGHSASSWTRLHFPWHFGWTVDLHRVGWESTPWPRQRPPRLSRLASTGQRAHNFRPAIRMLLKLIKVQYWLEELILGKGFTQKTNSNSQLYSDHDSQYKILVNMDLFIRSNYSPIAITNWAQQLLQICLILHFVTYLSQSFAAPGAFRNLFVSKQRGTEHSLNNFQLKLNEMVHRNLMIDVTK